MFCVFLFIVVLVRRNMMGNVPFRLGYAFWTVTGFVIVAFIATFAGSFEASSQEQILYIRDMLKLLVYFSLFFAIIHSIDNEKDLRNQLVAFTIAAAAGALIVIAQYHNPYRLQWFLAPAILERGIDIGGRASGAFMDPNAAAGTLTVCITLIMASFRFYKVRVGKFFPLAAVVIVFTAIFFTGSRAGFFALAGVLVLMGFIGKSKKLAWTLIITGIIAAFLFGGGAELLRQRIEVVYNPETQTWAESVEGRFEMWKSYFETATARTYVFGQGRRQGIAKNGLETHSAYVSIITVYGFGSMIWAGFALAGFIRRFNYLRKIASPSIAALGRACMWGLMAWGIFGLSADALSSYYPRYVLFFTVVILDRAYAVALQQAQAADYEQLENYQSELIYEGSPDGVSA